MVSDYLFCGTCFLNFRLCDINLFIEHKKNNCGYPSSGAKSSSEAVNSPTDAFVANLLECVQCFRRFSTAWPLLMHVQFEHQMLFANAFKHQQQYEQKPLQDQVDLLVDDSDNKKDSSDTVIFPENTSDDQSGIGLLTAMQAQQTLSVETQTVISSFSSPMRYRRKRLYPSCCTSLQTTVDEVAQRYVCTAATVSACNSSDTCCPPSTVVCNCQCLCASPSTTCLGCVSSSQTTIDCASCKESKAAENNVALKTLPCCLSLKPTQSPEKLPSDCMQRVVSSCCPCPPKSEKPLMTSTEAQTDFELEFISPDYDDIAMLFLSPPKSGTTSPIQSDQNLSEPPPNSETYTLPDNAISMQTTNLTVEGSSMSLFPKSNQPLLNSLSVVSMAQNHPVDSALNTAFTFSTNNQPASFVNRDSLMTASSCFLQPPVSTQPLFSTALISDSHTEINRPQFTCDQCGRVYRQKVHLRKHILIQHVGKKPFECPLCSYTTVEKSHLTVHIRTHTGERPFRCRVCDYSSSQNCTLKAHYMRKHSDSYLFCSKCSERFFTEQELHKHERQCFFERKMLI